jgi:hypothetical protein
MKYILLFILFICSSNIIKAQDTLSMRSGENILVKVIEVGTSEVKYKKLDNLNGPDFSILKSDLLTIKYENGTKEDFSSIKKIEEKIVFVEDLFIQGQNDAKRFYKYNKIVGTMIVANLLVLPILPSLAFSIAATSKIPKDKNLNYPNISLMQNEKYADSYRQEAKKIKNRKIWTSFGGSIVGLGLMLLLVSNTPFM